MICQYNIRIGSILPSVECIYIAKDSPGKKLIAKGKLSDIAPTVLYLMGLPVPKEMTAENLIRA